MKVVNGECPGDGMDELVTEFRTIGERDGCIVQGIDARYVAGEEHLRSAVEMARRAHLRDEGIADDPAMESLLYAAATRQIDRALRIGIGAETESVVVVVDGANEAMACDAVRELLEPGDGSARDAGLIRDWFGITDAELAATTASLEALVCERVALLQLDA